MRWQGAIPAVMSVVLTATLSETPVFAGPKAPAVIKPACPASRPDKISAGMAARLCEGRVEVSGLMTETTQVWAEKNGTFTVDTAFAPVRAKVGDSWVDMDVTLVPAADGSVLSRAHALGLTFSGAQTTDGDHDLASFGVGAERVTMGWQGSLPAPVIDGARATYLGVRPGVDLVLEATNKGFEQYFIVKDRAGLAAVGTIALPWRTPAGLATTRNREGDLELRNRKGELRGRMPSAYMWDAAVNAVGDHVRRAKVNLAVRKNKAVRGGNEVVLIPDAAFLARTDLTFPVTIDPFYAAVFPTDDIFVQTSWGVDTSGHADLRLGTYNGGSDTARTYLNIDTSEISGTRINWASLKLWEWHSQSCTPTTWEAWRTQAVNMSVKWTSQPALAGGWYEKIGTSTQTRGYSASCDDNWVEIDATAGFQTAANTGQSSLTIGLKAANESDSNSYMKFRSADYAGPLPHIMLNYDYRPEVESQETTPSSACVIGGGRPYINNLRPTLQAQLSDPEGAPITATFEWWVTGGSLIGSATTSQQASNTEFSAVVPAGAFTNNNTYSWRVRGVDAAGSVSSWSSWCEFTIDTTEPTINPGVWSPSFPQNGWAGVSGVAGNFTFGPGIGSSGPPTGRWLFNEGTGSTVVDSSGNNRPLTTGGGAVFAADRGGSVLRVAGGGYAATAAPPFSTNASFTVSAWAKASSVPTYSTVLSMDGGAGLPAFDLGTRDGKWHVDRRPYRDVYAYPTGVDGPVVTAGVWTHLMAVYDQPAGRLRLYVNGGFVGEVALSATFNWLATGGLQVGRSGGWNGDFFYGDIDEVRVFNKVASISEVHDGGDIASYQYGLDINPPSTTVNAFNGTWGNDATAAITPATDGPHTLYVRSQDRAGNQSAIVAYPFNVGPGGITAPKGGDVTGSQTKISSVAHPSTTGVTYQWRRGDADAWINIPVGHVVKSAGGGAVASWPLATTGSGAFADLDWNVEATLAAADAQSIPRDGPLQVRAGYTGGIGGPASPIKITFDRDKASASTSQMGPGELNLLTGNLTISGSDFSAGGMSITRSFNSRRPDGVDGMYGKGWVSSVVIPAAASPYKKLNVFGSLVQVTLPNDTTMGFTKKATTGTGATFDPPAGSEFVLDYTTTTDSYLLKDTDGNQVTFVRAAADPAGQYLPSVVVQGSSNDTTTVNWEKVTVDGVDVSRPTRILAPVPPGVNCAPTLVRGCQAVTFAYAMSTTATGTAPAAWGNHVGRVVDISFTAWDPVTATMRTLALARYAYDSTGRLRSAWDPRLDWTDASTHHLETTYAYNADGTISTVTPGGQQPWQLAYGTLPSDPGKGRIANVSRSALSAGTATSTVVYKVPISGAGAAYDLSVGQTARWGQSAAPVDATAVFPPNQVPANPPASYDRASVTYLDANGRAVNTAEPGGYIDTIWFDRWGNVARELSAGNRKRALDSSLSDAAAVEAEIAQRLSTVTVYSADGRLSLEVFGPEHDVLLPSLGAVRGRTHIVTRYDENAPTTGAPFDLPTTEITSTRYTDSEGYAADTDKRTTTTEYDWAQSLALVSTVDPAGLKLTTRMSYDSDGRLASETSPAGGTSTVTPSTRVTVYYQADGYAAYPQCGNRPEWDGKTCLTKAGGQPATGAEILTTTSTYDMFGEAWTTVESTSAGAQRTLTVNRDGAGRTFETTVVAPGFGEQISKRRNVYDNATGNLLRTQSITAGGSVSAEIIRTYDGLGRMSGYTDADGNASATTFDLLGRTATESDGKVTRTYAYDEGSERRGLVTSITDPDVGTFTGAVYDADGALVSHTWPNGVQVTNTVNEEGVTTGIVYKQPCGQAQPCTLYTETVSNDAHSQPRRRVSTLSTQDYWYDPGGRLTSVSDTVSGQCITRSYTFDKATNRTGTTTYNPGAAGICQTSVPAGSTAWSYDEAARVTNSGYGYDTLGRTLTMPGADTAISSGGQATLTYHVNDMVRTIGQGSRTATYTLDVVANRNRSWTDNPGGTLVSKIHHYSGDGDSPAWTDEGSGAYSRVIAGLAGMAATHQPSGGVAYVLINLHGDVVAGMPEVGLGLTYTSDYLEHGKPRNPADAGTRRYGWLGGAQRAADTPGGLALMGARVYAPGSGRFLSIDPAEGASANAYDYCNGDAVGCNDTSGQWPSCSARAVNRTTKVRTISMGWIQTPYWKVELWRMSLTATLQCRMSHEWTVHYLGAIGAILGLLMGLALGTLCGPAVPACSTIAGVIGGYIGNALTSNWYGGHCPQSKGVTSHGKLKVFWGYNVYYWRWWAGGGSSRSMSFRYGWVVPVWPLLTCN